LYWTFIQDHRAVLEGNPRMRMVLSLLENMDPDTLNDHRRRARVLLDGVHGTALLKTTPAKTDVSRRSRAR
jgi:deoxyribodipyrimidine photolyase-related protein